MRRKRTLNDYELIFLIQSGDEDVLDLMVEKYRRLIAKMIHKFNLAYEFDDLMQEGIIILHRSVMQFDPAFNKTFTRYFELNFKRHLISVVSMQKRRADNRVLYRREIFENNHAVREASVFYRPHLEEIVRILTPLEWRVYVARHVKCVPPDECARALGLDAKVVYNALHRAKRKIRRHLGDTT